MSNRIQKHLSPKEDYKMKKSNKLLIIMGICFLLASLTAAQTELPKAGLPVLSTSAGQSADVNTLNVILEQANVKYDYCDVPTVDMLKTGVGLGDKKTGAGFHVEITTDMKTYPKGTPYKTVIFAIGASLKGMGASGLTIEDELKRLESLIKYCKENNIFIIAVHSGGESKRGASGSNNERMIDAIAPIADLIVVVSDSNKDSRFTKISTDKNIPLVEVKYALGIVETLEKVFQ